MGRGNIDIQRGQVNWVGGRSSRFWCCEVATLHTDPSFRETVYRTRSSAVTEKPRELRVVGNVAKLLKVTQDHFKLRRWVRRVQVPELILALHSNYGRILYHSRDIRWKSRFFITLVFDAPLGGPSPNIVVVVWYGKKTRMACLSGSEKSFRIWLLISIRYMNVTDRQIPHNGTETTLCIASRGKNSSISSQTHQYDDDTSEVSVSATCLARGLMIDA